MVTPGAGSPGVASPTSDRHGPASRWGLTAGDPKTAKLRLALFIYALGLETATCMVIVLILLMYADFWKL